MDEKRCEWCGTLSPVEAEKCALCRIPFGVPVPPPQDWSHLTGNIPVITAPLLETTESAPESAPAPAPSAETGADPVAEPVVPHQVQREAVVSQPVPAQQAAVSLPAASAPAAPAAPTAPVAPVAAGFAAPATPVAEVVPSVGEMVVEAVRVEADAAVQQIPGWRAPDDPTLRVFADRLEERERRPRGGNPAYRRGRRRRRQVARLLVWALAVGLIAAFVILAPARLPSF